MSDITFEQVKPLIEQMPSGERDRLRSWLDNFTGNREIALPQESTWGEQLVALVNQFDLDEADQMDISDPEAWVRERRRTKAERRNPDWGQE